RHAGNDVAGLHVTAGIDRKDGVDRQQIARLAAPGELENLTVLAFDDHGGTQVLLAAGCTGAPVDDHALGNAGRLVQRFRHRLAFDQVLEPDRALDLGQDWPLVGLPLRNALTAPDVVALVPLQAGAILDAVNRALGAVLIEHHDRHVAGHAHEVAGRIANDAAVLDPYRALKVRFDEGLLRDLRGAADVERTHGELRAGLADRLRCNDADRLAHVDGRPAREVAAVAGGAHAARRLAGEHRTNAHLLDSGLHDPVDLGLAQKRAARHQDLRAARIAQVLGRSATKN